MLKLSRRALPVGALVSVLCLSAWAQGDDNPGHQSGGFTAAYKILAPRFEQMTGRKIVSANGASMGNVGDADARRIAGLLELESALGQHLTPSGWARAEAQRAKEAAAAQRDQAWLWFGSASPIERRRERRRMASEAGGVDGP